MTLNDTQEKLVGEYLLRASCFWNYLVDSLDEEIRSYLDTKDSRVLRLIEEKSLKLMSYISSYAASGFIENQVPERWKDHVAEMAQLDYYTLWCRYSELLDAIKQSTNENEKDRRPRAKNERSAQAASFRASDCVITDRKLTIKGPWPAELPLNQDVDLSQYETVIVGKRATPSKETLRLLGPETENYFVLFVN